MRFLSDNFATTQAGPVADRIIPILKAMVKIDAPPQPAFGKDGQFVFLQSRLAFLRELDARLGPNDIDMDYLFRLFSGGVGAGIVGKVMFDRAVTVVYLRLYAKWVQ